MSYPSSIVITSATNREFLGPSPYRYLLLLRVGGLFLLEGGTSVTLCLCLGVLLLLVELLSLELVLDGVDLDHGAKVGLCEFG